MSEYLLYAGSILSAGDIELKKLKFFPSWFYILVGEGKHNKEAYQLVAGAIDNRKAR